jgi:Immunity protein 10
MEFTAQIATWQLEEDFWLLGFADSEFETRQYFMLQRAFEFDENDVELGLDNYYFEINDQEWSGYGGIERFEIWSNRVHIRFEPQKVIALGIEPALEIHFKLESGQWDEFRTFLENIFSGTNVLELKT